MLINCISSCFPCALCFLCLFVLICMFCAYYTYLHVLCVLGLFELLEIYAFLCLFAYFVLLCLFTCFVCFGVSWACKIFLKKKIYIYIQKCLDNLNYILSTFYNLLKKIFCKNYSNNSNHYATKILITLFVF